MRAHGVRGGFRSAGLRFCSRRRCGPTHHTSNGQDSMQESVSVLERAGLYVFSTLRAVWSLSSPSASAIVARRRPQVRWKEVAVAVIQEDFTKTGT